MAEGADSIEAAVARALAAHQPPPQRLDLRTWATGAALAFGLVGMLWGGATYLFETTGSATKKHAEMMNTVVDALRGHDNRPAHREQVGINVDVQRRLERLED